MYAKVFTQIFDSSIAGNWKHRHVFEDLLKLADSEGFIDMTVDAIICRTRLPKQMVVDGLAALTEPDPISRTKDHEGRRLIPIDPDRGWGWKIVNYEKYRAFQNERNRTEYMREFMRRKRAVSKSANRVANRPLTKANPASASASASASVQGNGDQRGKGILEIGELRDLVSGLYGRKLDQSFSYEDQCYLAAIQNRPGHLDEFKEIAAFHARLTEKKFFPNSLTRLLQNWDSVLDRARIPTNNSADEEKTFNMMIPKIRRHDDAH